MYNNKAHIIQQILYRSTVHRLRTRREGSVRPFKPQLKRRRLMHDVLFKTESSFHSVT